MGEDLAIQNFCYGLLPHNGQGCQACSFIMSYGTISFLFKEEPQKDPPLSLWVVHDLGRKECLDFCVASVYSQGSAVVRLYSGC